MNSRCATANPESLDFDMLTHWTDERIDYDGSQLHAHWILRRFGLCGDAMVAFRGGCSVGIDEMADLEDLDGPGIAGDDMLHFLQERFCDERLEQTILRQRLTSCIAAEVLAELAPDTAVRRAGDDLFVGAGKLSISVATCSVVSTLMHFGVNVKNSGTPVPTSCLEGIGVEPAAFGRAVLSRCAAEQQSLAVARAKVRARGEAR